MEHSCFPYLPRFWECGGFAPAKFRLQSRKCLGGIWLLMFVPALLALFPGHVRWVGVIAIEGIFGRILGDFLIHYFNLAGAYIVCASFLAVALYLSTAFSFSAVQTWAPTRFAFVVALWNRWKDWREARAKKRMQKELEKRRAAPKPVITARLIPAPAETPAASYLRPSPSRFEPGLTARSPRKVTAQLRPAKPDFAPEVTDRADSGLKAKTTLPRIAGGFKLPPSSLLHRPDEQQAIDSDELKLLAQVLTSKYAEFDVHGQITQINPGPVVTTFEFKPEAGIKYSRITNLTDDLCLSVESGEHSHRTYGGQVHGWNSGS